MKELRIAAGLTAIVSDEDYESLAQFRWTARRLWNTWYAYRLVSGRRRITMHQQIMGKRPGFEIDHANRNGLDNRRENLRFATRAENSINKPPLRDGYKGVYARAGGRYEARLKVDQVRVRLGTYYTAEDAARAYDAAASFFYGAFAWTNFPEILTLAEATDRRVSRWKPYTDAA